MEMKKVEDLGAMIGIFLIIIVLVVGALYLVNQRMEKSKEFQNNINKAMATTTSTATIDDITNLEKEASLINFDDLGKGIDEL